jgi:hypothetical protein
MGNIKNPLTTERAVVLAFLSVILAEPALSEVEWGICFSTAHRDFGYSLFLTHYSFA